MTTVKTKECRYLLDLWNYREFKLTMLVVEAQGLSAMSGTADLPNPFVRISFGKETLQSKTVKGSTEPVFRDFVFHSCVKVRDASGQR